MHSSLVLDLYQNAYLDVVIESCRCYRAPTVEKGHHLVLVPQGGLGGGKGPSHGSVRFSVAQLVSGIQCTEKMIGKCQQVLLCRSQKPQVWSLMVGGGKGPSHGYNRFSVAQLVSDQQCIEKLIVKDKVQLQTKLELYFPIFYVTICKTIYVYYLKKSHDSLKKSHDSLKKSCN